MKLFTILYHVIKMVILIAVKIEELESRSECDCPLQPWVTQSPHRINTPYPKETEPNKANEVNSAQGLAQGIRSRASSVLSSCLYRGCWDTGNWDRVRGRKQGPRAPSGKGDKDQKETEKTWRLLCQGRATCWKKSWQSWLVQQVGDGALALASLKPDHWRQSQMFPGRAAPAATAACLSRLQPWLQPGHAQPGWALGSELSWTMTVSLPAPWAPGVHSQPQHQGHGGHHVRRSWWPTEGLPGGQAALDTLLSVEERRGFSSLPDKTFGMISVLGYEHMQSGRWTTR